jgi:hemolysin activation/secretion protein
MLGHQADAQNYQNVAPQVPAPGPAGTVVPPPSEEAEKAGNKVLIPALKGIKLVSDAGKIIPSSMHAEGIYEDGLPLLLSDPAMLVKLVALLDKPLTPNRMQALSKTIVTWYREHDHPLVDVIFPEQDSSGGTLQVIVMEFRVGQIDVTGNHWFSNDQVSSGLRVQPGDTVIFSELQQDLAWINQSPFRSVDDGFRTRARGRGDQPRSQDARPVPSARLCRL